MSDNYRKKDIERQEAIRRTSVIFFRRNIIRAIIALIVIWASYSVYQQSNFAKWFSSQKITQPSPHNKIDYNFNQALPMKNLETPTLPSKL